jgi:hypothetical protein
MEEKLASLRAKIAWTRMMVEAERAKASTLADLVCELEAMEKAAEKAPQPIRRTAPMGEYLAGIENNLVKNDLVGKEKIDRRPNYMSVPMNIILAKKADLMREIDLMRKIEGQRSNKLALVDDDTEAADECEQLVIGRLEIERLYDQYYYIERTGQLPDTVEAEKEVDPEIELKKFQLDASIKSAKNIIYKEGQKLKNIASYSKKNREEVIEGINAKIDRYEVELERLEVDRRMV